MNRTVKRYNALYRIIGLVLLPIIIAALYVIFVLVQGIFRYDQAYFTQYYQEAYQAPYLASGALELAIQTGDDDLYAQLTGLRVQNHLPITNPDIVYGVLLETDDNGYFHYMFINKHTYKRSMFYLQKVNDRWIVSPEDAHFLYYSDRWLKAFIPLTIVYWMILIVVELAIAVHRFSIRERDARAVL